MKDLFDISWKVDEPTYRQDKALSYSTLSRFERSGFNGLSTLFDEIKSPSLTFGSAVDTLITGNEEEFKEKFLVADFPAISDTIETIVKELFQEFHVTHPKLSSIPDEEIIGRAVKYNYQNNWKPETRARVIKEKAEDYYNLLYLSENKELLDTETYLKVLACVDALRTSEATKWYFEDNNMFDDSVKRYYQLKFKQDIGGITFRCMADLIIVDYKNKTIIPVDLKTSSHKEWDFYQSFLQWNYQIQARLYYRIIQETILKDDYFKDFHITNYRFIVVNKETLTPLVWECEFTKDVGRIEFETETKGKIILEDPVNIGYELSDYLNHPEYKVPTGITENGLNSITTHIRNL